MIPRDASADGLLAGTAIIDVEMEAAPAVLIVYHLIAHWIVVKEWEDGRLLVHGGVEKTGS